MDRFATLRTRMASSVPFEYRLNLALSDLIITAGASEMAPMKAGINLALQKEFERAGIDAADVDFFKIIDSAVRRRVRPNDEIYDDLFQELAANFLDRRKGELSRSWIPKVKILQDEGRLDNLPGWLTRVAQNLVKDLHRKLVTQQGRELSYDNEGDDEDSGGSYSLDRNDNGSLDPSSSTYAREIYEGLVKNFSWDKSKLILDILIEHGISGFISGGRSGGGGVTTLAEELGVTVQTISGYYRLKFQKDVAQAIRHIRDPELQEGAARMLASSEQHPMMRMCMLLDQVASNIVKSPTAKRASRDDLHSYLQVATGFYDTEVADILDVMCHVPDDSLSDSAFEIQDFRVIRNDKHGVAFEVSFTLDGVVVNDFSDTWWYTGYGNEIDNADRYLTTIEKSGFESLREGDGFVYFLEGSQEVLSQLREIEDERLGYVAFHDDIDFEVRGGDVKWKKCVLKSLRKGRAKWAVKGEGKLKLVKYPKR